MANYDDVKTIVQNRAQVLIQAAGPINNLNDILEADWRKILDSAIFDYSRDEPKIIMQEKVPGDLLDIGGVKFFELDQWDDDTSDADDVTIEHPVDLSQPIFLRRGRDLDFDIQERLDGATRKHYVRFMREPSGTPGTFRIRYTTRYSSYAEDNALSDLTKRAVQMVGLLAAEYTAGFLAAKYAQTRDPSLEADTVDYRTKAREFIDIGKMLHEEYLNRVDRPDRVKRSSSQFSFHDLDLSIQRGTRHGRNFLVHRRHRR